MKSSLLLAPIGLMLAMAAPAWAAPYCNDDRGIVDFIFNNDSRLDSLEGELNDYDRTALRQRGIDATRVEHWNGCIRAFVRQADGTETMQFFDPNSMQQVY